MANWVEQLLIALGIAGGGGFFGWFFTRKQQDANVGSTHISNADQVIQQWKGWGERLELSMHQMQEKMEKQAQDCHQETEEMNKQIETLRGRVDDLERENRDLKRKTG